ncbi:hypothetical protein Tco_1232832 [Tanacetum coccineum]
MAASAGPKTSPSSSVAPSSFDMSIGFPPPPLLKPEQIEYCKHAHKILKAKRANDDEVIKKEFSKLEVVITFASETEVKGPIFTICKAGGSFLSLVEPEATSLS